MTGSRLRHLFHGLMLFAALGPASGEILAEPAGGAVTPVPYMLACGTTEQLTIALQANGEAIAARGVAMGGALTQFWLNPATREWSIVFVDTASGQSCLVAAGSDFRAEHRAPTQSEHPRDRES